MQIMCKVLLLIALMAATMALGCGGRITIPDLEKRPTPTVSPSYVTFTDPVGLFSISHPPDWEVIWEFIGVQQSTPEERLNDVLEAKRIGSILFEQTGFQVVGSPDGHYTLVQVVASPWEQKHDPEVDFINQLRQLQKSEGDRIHGVSKILVDGREAILADLEEEGASTSVRYLKLRVPDGGVLWTLFCWIHLRKGNNVETCESILRSFRILQ